MKFHTPKAHLEFVWKLILKLENVVLKNFHSKHVDRCVRIRVEV